MAALRQTTISALFAKQAAPSPAPRDVGPSEGPAPPPQPYAPERVPAAEQPAAAVAEEVQPDADSTPLALESPCPCAQDSVASAPPPPRLGTKRAGSSAPCTTIAPLTQATLPAFRRLITTLLPVRYPDRTYAAILANAEGTVYCRLGVWRAAGLAPAAACSSESTRGTVAGAVCARVQDVAEPQDARSALAGSASAPGSGVAGDKELYVQMLGVLAPYRRQGLARTLLERVVAEALREHGIKRVFAHVWEANDEALAWYRSRGFEVRCGLVEGYYRKLQPSGARILVKEVGVLDGLRAIEKKNGLL